MRALKVLVGAGIFSALTVTITPMEQATANVPVGSMITGMRTSQLSGHRSFCARLPYECRISSVDTIPMQMSPEITKLIESVNLEVNRSVQPKHDLEIYGKVEYWTFPTDGVGDCEDYVLEKRRELNWRGIPVSNLLITHVKRANGEGHAVLTVRTDEGDYVLDNLNNDVKPWRETGYRFIRRQSTHYTGTWVSIVEDSEMLAGAVTSLPDTN